MNSVQGGENGTHKEMCIEIGAGDFDSSTAKYVIRAKIEIDGVVDKPDVIGAVFGQTEGLLGEDLDLRELQRTGRIGRIQIAIKSKGGSSRGEVVIPVSLNKTATAILAAALETVDRVGPCSAKVTLQKLEDIRGAKRRRVVSRAISILKGWEEEIAPGTEEITSAVSKGRKRTVAKYGPEKLPAGPDFSKADEIIIVEGRADVINLLKSGITNTVAVEGTNIPKSISSLTKKRDKKVVAFLDGDRGGDLILRELMQVADVDFIARAPEGKEVENLTHREITKALQAQIPAGEALSIVSKKSSMAPEKTKPVSKERKKPTKAASKPEKRVRRSRREPKPTKPRASVDAEYIQKLDALKESFKAVIYDENKDVVEECGVAELAKKLDTMEKISTILFDGIVTQRIVDKAEAKGAELIIAATISDIENKPKQMTILTYDDL